MTGSVNTSITDLFGKISAYSSIVQQNIGKYFNKFSPYGKEYESTLDLVLDILRALKYPSERLVAEILETITGDANIKSIIESGYHGSIDSIEAKLSEIESKQNNDSFINGLENSVKITISSILTGFLSCSISPFIPYSAIDKVNKGRIEQGVIPYPITIPTRILDFSNTLHVSPVSESGIYFYNTGVVSKYYRRSAETTIEDVSTIAGVRDENAERYIKYTYEPVKLENLTEEERRRFKKVVSVPGEVKLKEFETPPEEFIYTVRPNLTAESLYKTDDMNAFIWYVANRGDNYDEANPGSSSEGADVVYEYNKMAWDTRRLNAMVRDTARSTPEDWDNWLNSRTAYTEDLKLVKGGQDPVEDLYPILQFEPSELYGRNEHLLLTFPEQTYMTEKDFFDDKLKVTKTIYQFNADYLRSIKIFNWKTILMNMLYELNGISPIPDVKFNLSLSDEIIDAKLSTLILDTITADDKEVDDSYYTFSNEDYSEALKRAELKKYRAKQYETVSSAAIQNPQETPVDTMNSLSTAATLNEISSTITRGVYSVAGTSGSTGITRTTLSANLALESNFIYNLLFAIVKPLVRALLSPQIMLLFCINLDTMGLINLKGVSAGDINLINDFIFRKLAGIIKKLILQIKDAIVKYLLEILRKVIKKLMEEVAIIILLEQLNDYIRLLRQIMECIRKFGIGTTVSGIDEVTYADIIPEKKIPENT